MSTVAADPVACPACGRRNRVPQVAGGTPHCGSATRSIPVLPVLRDGVEIPGEEQR